MLVAYSKVYTAENKQHHKVIYPYINSKTIDFNFSFCVVFRWRQPQPAQCSQAETQKAQKAQEEAPQLQWGPRTWACRGSTAASAAQTQDQTGRTNTGNQEVRRDIEAWLIWSSHFVQNTMVLWSFWLHQCSHLHSASWCGLPSLTFDDYW